MYKTTDISLASYLEIKLDKMCSLEKEGKQVIFVFDEKVDELVDKFYADEDGMLSYANKIRNMKSRIINTK